MVRLRNFAERHPYLPLIVMAVLDVAASIMADSAESLNVGNVSVAYSAIAEGLEFFPEEALVMITAYSLTQKMRTLRAKEFEVDDVLDKLKRTGQSIEGIWKARG